MIWDFIKSKWTTILVTAFVTAIAVFMFFVFILDSTTQSKSVTINSETPPELILGNFYQIQGQDYYLANVSNIRQTRFDSYSASRWYSFGDSGSQARNLVFLDGKTLKSHRLYENNNSYILSIESFPQNLNSYNEIEEQTIIPVKWFIYYVIHEDENQDGLLNEKDSAVIGISDYDGYRYKEILNEVLNIYEYFVSEDGALLITYQTEQGRFASRFNLITQELILTEPLPDLGDEVE